MSVTNAFVFGAGVLVGVTNFLIGRYFAFLTPEQAAAIKRHKPGLEDLATLHKLGWVVMFFTPILIGAFTWLAVNGTAD